MPVKIVMLLTDHHKSRLFLLVKELVKNIICCKMKEINLILDTKPIWHLF